MGAKRMSTDRRALITREVLAAIRLGEDSGYDFKAVYAKPGRAFERPDDIADDLAAFANARGGRLVLGVDDKPRTVRGIDSALIDAVETTVREIALHKPKPAIWIETYRIEVPTEQGEARLLLVVDIPKSLQVHSSPSGYMRRFGASQRAMSTDELFRLMQSRTQARSIGFDELPVPRTTQADLDIALASRFAANGIGDAASWRKLHLLTEDDDHTVRLSVAACLTATLDPQAHFPAAYIQCVHYPDAARSEGGQLDAFDAMGTLDNQIDQAMNWLQRRISTPAEKQPWRTEQPAYDNLALFEAIVNAVVHRDYSIRGSRIRLHLFPDRLELYVPGALANTLTVDALDARQYVRNDLIASLLGRVHVHDSRNFGVRRYLERRGDGVPMILARSILLSSRRPRYEMVAEDELRLTIFGALGRDRS
jgi:ATP-dependent DNA helicase RecG